MKHPLLKVLLLLAVLGLLVLGVYVISHDTSIAAATASDKHERLATLPSPKIVLIGGSNLTYGLASDVLERDLHEPLVNMAYTAGVGLRFMMSDVLADIHAGDTVVISPEYEQFTGLLNGNGDLATILLYHPSSITAITSLGQIGAVLAWLPNDIQTKLKRFVLAPLAHRILGLNEHAGILYHRSDFDAQGDLIGYLGQASSTEIISIPLPDTIDPSAITTLNAFNARIRLLGAHAVLIFPPLGQDAYDLNRAQITNIARTLKQQTDLIIPADPERYVFPEKDLFDSSYHLTEPARSERTALMAQDLGNVLNTDTQQTQTSGTISY